MEDDRTVLAQELANGINLATIDTPMLLQARQMDNPLANRSKLETAEFYLRVETSASGKEAAAISLAEGEADYTRKARQKLTFKPHHYELKRMEATN